MDGAIRWYGNVRKKTVNGRCTNCSPSPNITTKIWRHPGRSCRRLSVTHLSSAPAMRRFTFNITGGGEGRFFLSARPIARSRHRSPHPSPVPSNASNSPVRWYASFMSEQPCPSCGGAAVAPRSARRVLWAARRCWMSAVCPSPKRIGGFAGGRSTSNLMRSSWRSPERC